MADEGTQTNEQSANYGTTPREILTNQARDQESIMILDRALARDQERRAEFMREQEREFIDAKDKRRTQIESMMLAHAEELRKQGVPDSELIEGVMGAFFNASPQEVFPEIAEELRQERYAMPLDEELQFLAENAPDALVEDNPAERERIVRIDAQFREQKGLPPLSEDIKKLWSDPETRGKILKYGSYGVMAAVLIGSGGAAAPAMLASRAAMRMMPHLGKAVEQGASMAGRTLVRHGFISPKTYAAVTEKVLALGNEAKTNKYMKAGRFAMLGAIAMAAGAAGADAAGLFDGLGAEAQVPDGSGRGAGEGEVEGATPQAEGAATEGATPQAEGAAGEGESPSAERTEPNADLSAEATSQEPVEEAAERGGWRAPNVLNGGAGAEGGWRAPNVLNGGAGAEGGWRAPNVLSGGAEATDALEPNTPELEGGAPNNTETLDQDARAPSNEELSQQDSTDNQGGDAAQRSIPAADLIQSMRDAGLSTTQIEMFYQGADLSAAELADVVELSNQPALVMQVLASQGVDVSTLPITATEATSAAPEDFAVTTEAPAPIEVTVQKGDTLSNIILEQCREQGIKVSAEVLYGTGDTPGLVEQIAQHNPHLTSPDMIHPGEKIILPVEVLNGGPVTAPSLSAEALKSAGDITSPAAPQESVSPSEPAVSNESSGNAGQARFQTATPGGAAQDLADGRFNLNNHVDSHLNNLSPGPTLAGAPAPEMASSGGQHSPDARATSGVAEDLAAGQFDLAERVNAHLAGYEPQGEQQADAEERASGPLPHETRSAGGITSELANGSFDLVDHVADTMAAQSEGAEPAQVEGEGWKDRLAGAFGKAKAMMASLTGSAATGTEVAAAQPSIPEPLDASGAENRSSWEVLNEAAESLRGELGASPQEGATESVTAAQEPSNDGSGQQRPDQEECPPPRMYARNSHQGGPGL